MSGHNVDPADRTLKLAVGALSLVPGAMGGTETYVRELVNGLRSQSLVAPVVFTTSSVEFEPGTRQVNRPLASGASSWRRLLTLARTSMDPSVRAQFSLAELIHFPLTVPTPWPTNDVPWLITLADVQHHDLPEFFSVAERRYRSLWYDHAARTASRVITHSGFSRDRIHEHLGVARDRISVIPLAVDTATFAAQEHVERDEFVLYPARGWPHKNHTRLIRAVGKLRQHRPDLTLVLTGGGFETLGPVPPWVVIRGLVSISELHSLYRTAGCLAFPSHYEGFGLPPLEAMSSGCPVAASRSGSLPEVCGPHAEYFDADDVDEMSQAISRALADRSSDSAVARITWAQRFSWQNVVNSHVETYLQAYAEHRANRR